MLGDLASNKTGIYVSSIPYFIQRKSTSIFLAWSVPLLEATDDHALIIMPATGRDLAIHRAVDECLQMPVAEQRKNAYRKSFCS